MPAVTGRTLSLTTGIAGLAGLAFDLGNLSFASGWVALGSFAVAAGWASLALGALPRWPAGDRPGRADVGRVALSSRGLRAPSARV